jgi:hypothetical protein
LFALIGFPHTDDAARAATTRPDDNDDPAIEPACRDEALLAIVDPLIWLRERPVGENLGCSGEIEPALPQRGVAFGAVEDDIHDYM